VLTAAARARIVLLGERHDAAEDHRWQADVLAGLAAHRQPLIVGFEVFTRRDQAALDAWTAGGLPVEELLVRTQWREASGLDPALYLPLLHFTRRHRVTTIGLNVDRGLVARTVRTGWAQIPAADRQGIGDPAPPPRTYEESLLATYAEHACRPADALRGSAGFARFLEAQLLWDRAMAEALRAAARTNEDALVVGIMGSGHLDPGGVPHQLAALGWTNVTVLLPRDATGTCDAAGPSAADAVFGTASLASEQPVERRHRCAQAPSQPPR
jgi:uncharacterized iron-regulated protein